MAKNLMRIFSSYTRKVLILRSCIGFAPWLYAMHILAGSPDSGEQLITISNTPTTQILTVNGSAGEANIVFSLNATKLQKVQAAVAGVNGGPKDLQRLVDISELIDDNASSQIDLCLYSNNYLGVHVGVRPAADGNGVAPDVFKMIMRKHDGSANQDLTIHPVIAVFGNGKTSKNIDGQASKRVCLFAPELQIGGYTNTGANKMLIKSKLLDAITLVAGQTNLYTNGFNYLNRPSAIVANDIIIVNETTTNAVDNKCILDHLDMTSFSSTVCSDTSGTFEAHARIYISGFDLINKLAAGRYSLRFNLSTKSCSADGNAASEASVPCTYSSDNYG